jgi:hypothetical protein
LDIDAPHAGGDLTVTGFVTRRSAEQIGALFADAIRRHFGPGTRVDITTQNVITRKDTHA